MADALLRNRSRQASISIVPIPSTRASSATASVSSSPVRSPTSQIAIEDLTLRTA